MLRKSHSRSSLFSSDRQLKVAKIDPSQICKEVEDALSEASRVLNYDQFASLSFKLLRSLIRRAQVEGAHSQSLYLQTISRCVEKYGSNVELTMRTILLQILCQLNSSLLEDVRMKIDKVKHTVIHTPLQYLLAKAFLLQERFFLMEGQELSALNSLKRCIQLNQAHLVEYLQDSQQVRQQIVDHVILAHYENFRLRKLQKPALAMESLAKAVSAARNSYRGQQSILRSLERLYQQQEHLLSNADRYSTRGRALTQIVQFEPKRGLKVNASYSWEEEKIIAQLFKMRDSEKQVISQTNYEIQLDNSKIRMLRSTEWLSVSINQVAILEEQLLHLLGVNLTESKPAKEMTTRIEMRSRQQIIRKDDVSSEDDNESIFNNKMGFLKDHRAPSRAHSSKKSRDPQ